MVLAEPRSLVGSTTAACAELALHNPGGLRRARRVVRVTPPLSSDAMPAGTCMACGYPGKHETAESCIDALRDEIARLQFRIDKPKESAAPPSRPAPGPELAATPAAEPAVPTNVPEHGEKLPAPKPSARRTIEHVTPYEIVLHDLEQLKLDAESGITAIRRLMSHEGAKADDGSASRAVRVRSSNGDGIPARVIAFLEANREKSYARAEIADGIDHKGNNRTIANTLHRLASEKRIEKDGRGKFKARTSVTA